ncbi:hypothetical protein [Thermus thalpophilus]|uniref:hypothetical protein n=1 Tax=Thermus thalpophilus TaxID=2908147 RepID=UPI001FAAD7D0|nr:hypothetical protein [Thermus thalpophilus]
MWEEGLLPRSPSRLSAFLSRSPQPTTRPSPPPLAQAPKGGYLSLPRAGIPFVGGRRRWVKGRGKVSVGELSERHPPGRVRHGRRFGVYAKRARAFSPWAGQVTGWRGMLTDLKATSPPGKRLGKGG